MARKFVEKAKRGILEFSGISCCTHHQLVLLVTEAVTLVLGCVLIWYGHHVNASFQDWTAPSVSALLLVEATVCYRLAGRHQKTLDWDALQARLKRYQ